MNREYAFWVYIMASGRNGTLYIGMTNDLYARVKEHREGLVPGFTTRYGVSRLVYFEEYQYADEAISREKVLKRCRRAWKIELIESGNPEWRDLWSEIAGE